MMKPKKSEIIGHKTFSDGAGGFRHEPLTRGEADKMMASIEIARKKRVALMPDEKSALRMMTDAYFRLKELGWREAIYCPKDGTHFDAIEAGSSGMHECFYEGEWPDGHWWMPSEGDLWPSRPILWRAAKGVKDDAN